MASAIVTIHHPVGLHARPASVFVRTAANFPCTINVRNLSGDSKMVNAKSILAVLTLGANQGAQIEIQTSGEGEEEALKALVELVESNFGE